MIWKDFTYKWFTFSDDTATINNIVLQDVKKSITLNTTIFNKQTYHGSVLSNTLASGRLFTFSWQIFWKTREERANGQKKLNDIIKPEWIFWDTKGFYELSFFQDDGTKVKCNARVYSMPDYTTTIEQNYIINFTFDLFVENSYFVSFENKQTDQTVSTIIGWNKLQNKLPNKLNWFTVVTYSQANITDIDDFILIDVEWNEIMDLVQDPSWSFPNANNLWNFVWPVRIEVIWELLNPKVTNLTNWRFYWLTWITTNHLIIDNTWSNFIVEDNWVNLKSYRASWSKQLYISPWINEFNVTADNLSLDENYQIKIIYNDYYINN